MQASDLARSSCNDGRQPATLPRIHQQKDGIMLVYQLFQLVDILFHLFLQSTCQQWSHLDWMPTNRKTASCCLVTPWLKIHQQKDGVMVLCHTLTENPPTEKLRHVALSHLDWKSTRRKTASCCTISCSTLLASSSMSTCQQRLHFIGYPLEERL